MTIIQVVTTCLEITMLLVMEETQTVKVKTVDLGSEGPVRAREGNV